MPRLKTAADQLGGVTASPISRSAISGFQRIDVAHMEAGIFKPAAELASDCRLVAWRIDGVMPQKADCTLKDRESS